MTLLFAQCDAQATIVAADQRLTFADNGFIWDEQSSKLVVVLCTDGMAVIGYTGLAYINRQPTDEFIARHIVRLLVPGCTIRPGVMLGGKRRPIRIGTTLKYAIDTLRKAVRRFGYPFSLIIAGQRRFKRRIFPFVALIDRLDHHVSYPSMRKGSVARRDFAVAGDCGDPILLKAIYELNLIALREHLPGRDPIELRLRAMISAFEFRRATTSTIGDTLHIAVISLGRVQLGMWRGQTWVSPGITPDLNDPLIKAALESAPTVYSPWIVSSALVSTPHLGTGGGKTSMSAWYWEIIIEELFAMSPPTVPRYQLTDVALPPPYIGGWFPARRKRAP